MHEAPQLPPQVADPVVVNPTSMMPAEAPMEVIDRGTKAADTFSQWRKALEFFLFIVLSLPRDALLAHRIP